MSEDEIIDWKWQLVDAGYSVCPAWKLDESMRPVLNALFRWCMGLKGTLDPSKGLMLYGDVGVGKTTMLEIMRVFCMKSRPRVNDFRFTWLTASAIRIAAEFGREGYEGIQSYCDSYRLGIDDLGCEPVKVGYYGTTVNVMEHLLLSRYDGRWDDSEPRLTHVTTNLSPNDIIERYGPRVYDRLKELCNWVEICGRTNRKAIKEGNRAEMAAGGQQRPATAMQGVWRGN